MWEGKEFYNTLEASVKSKSDFQLLVDNKICRFMIHHGFVNYDKLVDYIFFISDNLNLYPSRIINGTDSKADSLRFMYSGNILQSIYLYRDGSFVVGKNLKEKLLPHYRELKFKKLKNGSN